MVALTKRKEANSVEPHHERLPELGVFLADDVSGSQLMPVLGRRGFMPDVIRTGGVEAAIASITGGYEPRLLIIDLGDRPDPRGDIAMLADVCPPGTVVLAIGAHNDVTLYRDLIQAGVQDYLLKPLQLEVFEDAFDQALEALEEEPQDAVDPAAQRVIMVTGVRGGVGASTVAANLAYLFSNSGGETAASSTVLVDLDLIFGTGAMQFDMEPGRGLIDALLNPGRVDGLFVDRAAVKPFEKLAILAAEAPINGVDGIRSEAYEALFETLIDTFPTLVIDQPRGSIAHNQVLLQQVTDIVIVTDHSISAVRDCIRMLGYLQSNAPQAKLHIVSNSVGMCLPEVQDGDFTNSIEQKLLGTMPHDPKASLLAAQKGSVVCDVAPTSKFAKALSAIALKLRPAVEEAPKSIFAKLMGK